MCRSYNKVKEEEERKITSATGAENRTMSQLKYSTPNINKIVIIIIIEKVVIKNSTNYHIMFFTITAEILARSLANFYRQYADRHMNLKFVRRVSERERVIRPFVIVKNKLMSVYNASVLLLTMNFVITLSK